MGFAERHLSERDPSDNPAVGFRQTSSSSYRVESDPFRDESRAELIGGKKDEDERGGEKEKERTACVKATVDE